MLETIYKSKFLIDEIEHSPFSKQFISLINWSLKEGYHPTAIQGRFAGIVHFLRWSVHRNITPKTIRRHHVDEFLKLLSEENKSTVRGGGWAFLKRFFKSFQQESVPLMEEPLGKIPTWIESHADKAIHHLSNVNGLSEYSLVRIRGLIRSLLIWRFKDKKGDLSKLDAKSVLTFMELRAQSLSPGTLQAEGGFYKIYFRYLYLKQITKTNLCTAVPRAAVWKDQRHLHVLTGDEINQLLEAPDLTTKQGIRDFAILLLLSRYGLRAIEVMRLRLTDFRWQERKILIQGKGKKISDLPLHEDVGHAVRRYIDNARPFTDCENVFLTSRIPYKPFSNIGSLTSIVMDSLIRAGIKTPIKGARLLRYSAASNILNSGGTLEEVQQLLRHSQSDTSARYIRVDFARLAHVAQPWPTTEES